MTYTLLICLFLDEKKNRVCCCFFDYYAFMTSTKKNFTLYAGLHTDHNGLTSITLCNDTEVVKVCLNCVYNALVTRKFDESCINDPSRWQTYYAYSSYYERIRGTPKTCLGSVKSWINRLAEPFKKEFNRSVIMKSCCVQCFRKLILDFLSDEF